MKDYAGDDEPFVRQFLVYASQGKCLRDCKARTLPSHLQDIDPAIVQDFRRRKPFSYLHYAYYQVRTCLLAQIEVFFTCSKSALSGEHEQAPAFPICSSSMYLYV